MIQKKMCMQQIQYAVDLVRSKYFSAKQSLDTMVMPCDLGWSWANIYGSAVGWLENTRMSMQPIWYYNIEGEQKLSTLGQMSKQAQFKKYMSDQAVLWPK